MQGTDLLNHAYDKDSLVIKNVTHSLIILCFETLKFNSLMSSLKDVGFFFSSKIKETSCGRKFAKMIEEFLLFFPKGDQDFDALEGIPKEEVLLKLYSQYAGVPYPIPNWDFYIALSFFKLAAISQVSFQNLWEKFSSFQTGKHVFLRPFYQQQNNNWSMFCFL